MSEEEASTSQSKPKRRWNSERYNEPLRERRRERYHTDAEYRQAQKDAARKRYEKDSGGKLSRAWEQLHVNIQNIRSFGQIRRVYVGMVDVAEELCLTEAEMANVMGKHYQSFQRMIGNGRWPVPIYSSRNYKTRVGVYLLEEAEAMMHVYANHFKDCAHYYLTHTKTREALYRAATNVRSSTELGRRALSVASDTAGRKKPAQP
jgi:hypothetical protein